MAAMPSTSTWYWLSQALQGEKLTEQQEGAGGGTLQQLITGQPLMLNCRGYCRHSHFHFRASEWHVGSPLSATSRRSSHCSIALGAV